MKHLPKASLFAVTTLCSLLAGCALEPLAGGEMDDVGSGEDEDVGEAASSLVSPSTRTILVKPGHDFALNLHYNAHNNGAVVNLWQRNGHASQIWTFGADGRIHPSGDEAFCLAHGGDPDAPPNGTSAVLWSCVNHNSQRWAMWPDGTIRKQSNPNKCLDLAYNAYWSGNVVDVFDCNGHESQQWMSPSYGDTALARMYAPRLRFDGAAPNYPMSAQTFFDQAVAVPQTYRVDNTDYGTITSNQVPTYYQIVRCGSQMRIMYWWFYGYQPTCDGVFGSHNGDWENVMVTLSDDRTSIAAVTYYAHGKHYTRLPARGGVEMEHGAHPIVYPGKTTHGAYYTQGGSGSCLFWEDFHNNGSGYHMDSWNNLISLDGDGEPWMAADRAGSFAWGSDGVNTHPTLEGPSCSMAAMAWEPGKEAWWHTQCEVGDTDSGTGCIQQCAPGYDTFPLTCSRCEGDWWNPLTWYCDTYSRQLYGYDYPIPTSDLGLLVNDYD